MKDACQRYLEEPEGNAEHLAQCADCRALFDTLGLRVGERAVAVEDLPLAPWEGASHRAWPLVAVVGVIVAVAVAVCVALGVRPVDIAQRPLVSMADMYGLVAGYAAALRQASIIWQIGFGFLFFVVNTALVLLLRRAPRGIDA